MPRYFFHVNDGSTPDAEGVELESIAQAKCEAVKMAGVLICERAGAFWDTRDFRMTVSDADGLPLFSLALFGAEAAALRRARDTSADHAARATMLDRVAETILRTHRTVERSERRMRHSETHTDPGEGASQS